MMNRTVAALNRQAWGWFLLAGALAAAWIGLNFVSPDLTVGRVPLRLGVMLACDAVILYGLWRALARTDFSPAARVTAWIGVALILTIWIAAVWTLAANGVFQKAIGKVPVLPLAIFLPVVLGLFVLTRSQAVGSLLDATPASWLVGIQVYRILGGMFLVYWIRSAIPGAFALPAGIGDVATGLLALPAAVWIASGLPIGRRIGIRWNLLGLFDFAVAVTMGLLTSPGPAHLLARAHPNTLIATFPTAMVPAFAVPFSTLLHVLSLRQLSRARTAVALAKEEPVGIGA
ncbi:MAG TPA: hypothetical protein VN541_07525 [Tepidisphaeraceae bacterium]|nr:hypothetical protein [Tepidisphaeraceae bacterium]